MASKSRFGERVRRTLLNKSMAKCYLCSCFNTNGDAAHIISYSDDGPRSYKLYDKYKNMDEKSLGKNLNSIDNAIYACKDCHTKIDNNSNDYSVEYLLLIKEKRETNKYVSKYRMNFGGLLEIEIQKSLLIKSNDELFIELYEKYIDNADPDNEFIGWIIYNLSIDVYQISIEKLIDFVHITIDHLISNDDYLDDVYAQMCFLFMTPLLISKMIDTIIDKQIFIDIFIDIYKYSNNKNQIEIINNLNLMKKEVIDDQNIIKNENTDYIDMIDKMLLLCTPKPFYINKDKLKIKSII